MSFPAPQGIQGTYPQSYLSPRCRDEHFFKAQNKYPQWPVQSPPSPWWLLEHLCRAGLFVVISFRIWTSESLHLNRRTLVCVTGTWNRISTISSGAFLDLFFAVVCGEFEGPPSYGRDVWVATWLSGNSKGGLVGYEEGKFLAYCG